MPSPGRFDPPPGPPPRLARPPTAATRGGSQGTGDDNHQLGLGHLRDNPERSRSTAEGRAKRARAPKGRHAARQRDGPDPTAGKGSRSRHTAKKRAERVRCVRRPRAPTSCRQARGRESEVGPDSAPLPFRTPPRVAREERGPRTEREERSHSPGMSVPRPARLRPGPGERDVTTSISKRENNHTHAAGGGPARHTRLGAVSQTARGVTHTAPRGRPRRTVAGARRPEAHGFFLSCDGAGAGGEPGFGLQPWSPGRPEAPSSRPTPANPPRSACPHLSRATNRQLRAEQSRPPGDGGVSDVSRRPPGAEPRKQATEHGPIGPRRGGVCRHGATWSTPETRE